MILNIHHPAPPVNQIVDHVVCYEHYSPPHTRERLLPDGGVDLIIDLTEKPKNLYDNADPSRFTAFRRAWISGVRREYITIDSGQDSSMIVVRFRPGAAYWLLGLPLGKLQDRVLPMDELLGREFGLLREALLEAPTPAARFARLDDYFLQKIRRRFQPDPVVDFALQKIHAAPDLLTMDALARKTGYSHRHFIQLFEKYVGITPKYYLRLLKFQRVLQALERQTPVRWTDLAYACGYYDQAHFIKEFRHFSGYTPTTYLDERGEFLNYVPLFAGERGG